MATALWKSWSYFNPTRVRLKHADAAKEWAIDRSLQPDEGSSETQTTFGESMTTLHFNPTRVRLKPVTVLFGGRPALVTSTRRGFV